MHLRPYLRLFLTSDITRKIDNMLGSGVYKYGGTNLVFPWRALCGKRPRKQWEGSENAYTYTLFHTLQIHITLNIYKYIETIYCLMFKEENIKRINIHNIIPQEFNLINNLRKIHQ